MTISLSPLFCLRSPRAPVVNHYIRRLTAETQRTQRGRREISNYDLTNQARHLSVIVLRSA